MPRTGQAISSGVGIFGRGRTPDQSALRRASLVTCLHRLVVGWSAGAALKIDTRVSTVSADDRALLEQRVERVQVDAESIIVREERDGYDPARFARQVEAP